MTIFRDSGKQLHRSGEASLCCGNKSSSWLEGRAVYFSSTNMWSRVGWGSCSLWSPLPGTMAEGTKSLEKQAHQLIKLLLQTCHFCSKVISQGSPMTVLIIKWAGKDSAPVCQREAGAAAFVDPACIPQRGRYAALTRVLFLPSNHVYQDIRGELSLLYCKRMPTLPFPD